MKDLCYSTLDPGIRDVVRRVREAGFDTTDSGDGVTKIAAGWAPYEEALPYPHVACSIAKDVLVEEAQRLLAVLGVNWHIEATYCPNDDIATLMASQPFRHK